MVPSTRRAFLHGAVGAVVALAGCSGLFDGSAETTSTASDDPNEAEDGPDSGSESDPEALLVRADGDRPPIWLADTDDGDAGRPTPRSRRRLESTVIDGPSGSDRIAVADDRDRERVDAFVAATDLEAETLYLETVSVEECFRLELCSVAWTPAKISTDYARRSRSYDERCAVDERIYEARLIRIHDSIDADGVNSYSSSIGTGTCDRRRSRSRAEGRGGPGPATPEDSGSPTSVGENTTDAGGDR